MALDEVVHHLPEFQKSIGRQRAFEMPHRLITLPDVLVVPLDRIVVVFQPVLSASYCHTAHEPCYAVEAPIESPLILLWFIANEGH